MHLPNDIAAVQAKVKSNKKPAWFYIDGSNVSLIGSIGGDSNFGSFCSYGEQWWAISQKVS